MTGQGETGQELRDQMRAAVRPWFNYFAPGDDPQPSYPERVTGAADDALAVVKARLDEQAAEIERLKTPFEARGVKVPYHLIGVFTRKYLGLDLVDVPPDTRAAIREALAEVIPAIDAVVRMKVADERDALRVAEAERDRLREVVGRVRDTLDYFDGQVTALESGNPAVGSAFRFTLDKIRAALGQAPAEEANQT